MRIGVFRAMALILLVVVLIAVPAAAAPTPAFSLELFNDQTLKLADLKGTAVILLFWAQW